MTLVEHENRHLAVSTFYHSLNASFVAMLQLFLVSRTFVMTVTKETALMGINQVCTVGIITLGSLHQEHIFDLPET